MDVAAAFPSVARGCLLRKMRAMGIDEDLVGWTDSFMCDRRVIMSVGGQDDDPREVTTGLPQGSPISPALFAIYIADIHATVESQAQDSRGISFVDDVTWLVEGRDVGEVVQRLERCAAASLEWAEGNAVRFETSKTEAILFSRRKAHKRCQASHVGVEGNETADRYAKAAADRSAPCRDEATPPELIDEASLSYMARTATEARSRATVEWITANVRAEQRYRPPPGGGRVADSWEAHGRSWLAVSTSSCPDMRTSGLSFTG